MLEISANLAVSQINCSSQFRICLIEGYMAVLLILNHGFSKPLINKYIDLLFHPLDRQYNKIIKKASNVHIYCYPPYTPGMMVFF